MAVNVTISTHLLDGRRVGKIVNQKTLDEKETVNEALENGYVVGKASSILQMVEGVGKSMVDGISRDGDGRKVDEYVSIQPSLGGALDSVYDEVDKNLVSVNLIAKMLKECAIDVSGWSFTIEGATGSFTISSITTGDEIGVVDLGGTSAVCVNGEGFDFADTDSVVCVATNSEGTTKTETIAASSFTSRTSTRVDFPISLLGAFKNTTFNGATVVFTFKMGTKKCVKSATFKYEA